MSLARVSGPLRSLAFVALLGVSLSACAGVAPGIVTSGAPRAPRAVRGTVRFEARSPTPAGASQRLERLPARFVSVRFLDASGRERALATTDAEGAYVATVPDDVVSVEVVAAARGDGFDLSVSPDGLGRVSHSFARPLPRDAATLELVALEEGTSGEAGAFHILDTMTRGAIAAHAWSGRPLPPLYAYWGRGVTSAWSYYHGERPKGSGRYALELLGGERDAQATTDTDEHDETIVLHELGHFVFDTLSSDSSHGGDHPPGTLIDPGLAWEEARATWFAATVLGAPRYRDTVGVEPQGRLRLDEDIERRAPGPIGFGSESTVSEVLWDLVDGSLGIADGDDDGVALDPAVVMRAMIDVANTDGAYPCLPTFLSFLVEHGVATKVAIADMLSRGAHPSSLLPLDGSVAWPLPLELGKRIAGKIDGLSDPAPSGGPPRAMNGFDAVKTFRIHVPERGFLEVELVVLGTGRSRDHQDVDVELRTIRSASLGSARGQDRVERVGRFVTPGYYIVIVRDGGAGNRVGFQLLARLSGTGAPVATRALDPRESAPSHSRP